MRRTALTNGFPLPFLCQHARWPLCSSTLKTCSLSQSQLPRCGTCRTELTKSCSAAHTHITNVTPAISEAVRCPVPRPNPNQTLTLTQLPQFPALKASSLRRRGEQKASEELILCLRSNADVFMSVMNFSAFGAITSLNETECSPARLKNAAALKDV